MHEIIKEFVLANRAAREAGLKAKSPAFTLEVPSAFNAEVKPHYTFKVAYLPPGETFDRGTFAVQLLTGSDNTRDYTYLGLLHPETGAFRTTRKSKMTADSWPCRLFERLMAVVWSGDWTRFHASGFKVHHEGKCGRCGRPLTVPLSIKTGLGPECASIMGV